MIASTKSSSAVLSGDAEKLSPKVIELRVKIQDKDYLNSAIQRIAQVLSNRLVENPKELKLSFSRDDVL